MTTEQVLQKIVPPEAGPAAVSAGARAEVLSWAPNTRKANVAGWNDFTSWCLENRRPGLPAAPADAGRYLEHLMEQQGRTLATARLRLAAIAAVHRMGEHPDPTPDPLVKATARIQRVHQGKRRRKETETEAAKRAMVDLALLQVMRDGLLRRSEASALRWGEVELHEDGSGRLHVARSKTDQSAEGAVLCLGPPATQALLAIRPEEAVIDPAARVFGLSVSQISRRIKAATKIAGLGEGFGGHSARVGMAQDLSAAGAELMTAGREVEGLAIVVERRSPKL